MDWFSDVTVHNLATSSEVGVYLLRYAVGVSAMSKNLCLATHLIMISTHVLLQKIIFAQSQVMVSNVFVGNSYT